MKDAKGANIMNTLMSKLYLFILLLVISLLVNVNQSFAAFDQLIPQRQRGKFFTPSIRLRTTYNDNVSAKRGTGGGRGIAETKIGSMINFYEPKISFRIPLDQTFLGVDYKYSFAYYWHRPTDNEDVAHDINGRFKHNFSPRLSLDLKNDYIHQESGIIKRDTVIVRDKGDFERNTLDIALKYDIMRNMYINFRYGNEFLDFDTLDASQTFDYNQNLIGFENTYIVSKDLLLSLGYTFRDRQYTLRENADYDSHLLFGGMNYQLGKYFTLNGISGVDFRKLEAPSHGRTIDFSAVPPFFGPGIPLVQVFTPGTQGATKLGKNPYVDVRLTTNYFNNMLITLGYLYVVETTEQENFSDATTQSGTIQVSYRIFPKVTIDFNLVYSVDSYEGDVFTSAAVGGGNITKQLVLSDPSTESFRMGAVVSYQVTPWLFYEAGYIRTDFDSDFNTSTWERNEIFTGVNAIF